MRADRHALAWLVRAGVRGGLVLFIYLKSYQNCNKDSAVAAVNGTGGTSLLPPALPCAIYIKLHLQQSSPGSQNSIWSELKRQGQSPVRAPLRLVQFLSDLKSLKIFLEFHKSNEALAL